MRLLSQSSVWFILVDLVDRRLLLGQELLTTILRRAAGQNVGKCLHLLIGELGNKGVIVNINGLMQLIVVLLMLTHKWQFFCG